MKKFSSQIMTFKSWPTQIHDIEWWTTPKRYPCCLNYNRICDGPGEQKKPIEAMNNQFKSYNGWYSGQY